MFSRAEQRSPYICEFLGKKCVQVRQKKNTFNLQPALISLVSLPKRSLASSLDEVVLLVLILVLEAAAGGSKEC